MGFMKALKTAAAETTTGLPWFLPGGTYKSTVEQVIIGDTLKGKRGQPDQPAAGPYPVYRIKFAVDPSYAAKTKAPTPFDLPDLWHEMDTNLVSDKALLYFILGKPVRDGNAVRWDSTGQVQWNGAVDDSAKFVGSVELTIDTEEPRAKRPPQTGYWYANYEVVDVSKVGESQDAAAKAQMMLLEDAETPIEEPPTPAAPPAPATTRKRS